MEYNVRSCALRTRDRKCHELEIRKDKVSNCINSVQKDYLVLVSQKSTNMQYKSTKNTLEDIKNMETAQKSNGKKLKTLIASLEDSLAKRSVSLENVGGSTIQEERSFLKSLDALGKNNHAYVCLKTSKAYYHTTKVTRSLPSLPRWMNWGTTVNGKCLTARISVSHKTENECSLSDILEDEVDEKYFLSDEATKRLLSYKDNKQSQIQSRQERNSQMEVERTLLNVNSMHKK